MLVEEPKTSKQKILEGTFDYLIKNGLENASIRDICNHIGYLKGSVYYHYENKDELICAATEYGLKCISDKIFKNFYKDASDIDNFFNTCLDYIDNVKNELRFIYQVASSHIYGERIHNSNFRFRHAYDDYARKLADMSGGNFEDIQPIIYSFAATVVDYAIWQDRKETQIQLNYLCKMLKLGMKYAKKGNAMDLFEYLKNKLNCQYISDLRYGETNRMAKRLIQEMNLDNYTPFALSDMAEYLYNYKGKFETIDQAKLFFAKGVSQNG